MGYVRIRSSIGIWLIPACVAGSLVFTAGAIIAVQVTSSKVADSTAQHNNVTHDAGAKNHDLLNAWPAVDVVARPATLNVAIHNAAYTTGNKSPATAQPAASETRFSNHLSSDFEGIIWQDVQIEGNRKYEPGAENDEPIRWIAETSGATRLLEFQSLYSQPLLADSNRFSQQQATLTQVNDVRQPHTMDTLRGLTPSESSLSMLINDNAVGLLTLEVPDAFESDEPTPHSSGSPKSAEEDTKPIGDLPDNSPLGADLELLDGVGTASPTAKPLPSATQGLPEPIALPILLCGWLFIARTRRRKLYDDVCSFRIPPGSSDFTPSQLPSVRRIIKNHSQSSLRNASLAH